MLTHCHIRLLDTNIVYTEEVNACRSNVVVKLSFVMIGQFIKKANKVEGFERRDYYETGLNSLKSPQTSKQTHTYVTRINYTRPRALSRRARQQQHWR